MLIKMFENTWRRFKVTIPQISKEEWVLVVQNIKSYIAVQTVLQQQFNQTPPCKKTIHQNITKYCLHGTSLNWKKENSGRQKTVLKRPSN